MLNRLLDEGKKEVGELAPLVEDLNLTLKSNRLHGKLIVYILNAFEMIPEDGDSVDPLVEILFDNKKKRTQAKKKSLNAEYKEKLVFDVDFNGISVDEL
jgi:hypothetical protein